MQSSKEATDLFYITVFALFLKIQKINQRFPSPAGNDTWTVMLGKNKIKNFCPVGYNWQPHLFGNVDFLWSAWSEKKHLAVYAYNERMM